jgi:hypothetical protein
MCASVWVLSGVCWVGLSRQMWCGGKSRPFRAQAAARRIPKPAEVPGATRVGPPRRETIYKCLGVLGETSCARIRLAVIVPQISKRGSVPAPVRWRGWPREGRHFRQSASLCVRFYRGLCVRRHVCVCAGEKGGPSLSWGMVRAQLSPAPSTRQVNVCTTHAPTHIANSIIAGAAVR